MKIITPKKATSWPERLRAMVLGGEMIADFFKRNTVRYAINKVSLKENFKFSTEKITVKKKEILLIKRTQ